MLNPGAQHDGEVEPAPVAERTESEPPICRTISREM